MKKIFFIIILFFIFGLPFSKANTLPITDCTGQGFIERYDHLGKKIGCFKKDYADLINKNYSYIFSNEPTETDNGTIYDFNAGSKLYLNGEKITGFYDGFFTNIPRFSGFKKNRKIYSGRSSNIGIGAYIFTFSNPSYGLDGWGHDGKLVNRKIVLPVYLKVEKAGEYIISGGADNDLEVKVNGKVILEKSGEDSWHDYNLKTIYLNEGDYFLEFSFLNEKGYSFLAGEIIGRFDKGSFINYDTNTLKSSYDIKNFISSGGNSNYTLERFGLSYQAPNNWINKRIWNTKNEVSSYAPFYEGNICPEGYHAGLRNPTPNMSGKSFRPDVCIKYTEVHEQTIQESTDAKDYIVDGFFVEEDTRKKDSNSIFNSCKGGYFPRENSTNVYVGQGEQNFKCISMDTGFHSNGGINGNDIIKNTIKYTRTIRKGSGVSSCGHGAVVIGHKDTGGTITLNCERKISNLNGIYLNAFKDKELYVYTYHKTHQFMGLRGFLPSISSPGINLTNLGTASNGKTFSNPDLSKVQLDDPNSRNEGLKDGNYREYVIDIKGADAAYAVDDDDKKSIKINIYADKKIEGTKVYGANEFENGDYIGDGTIRTITYLPHDKFNNYILPVKKLSGDWIRKLNFKYSYDNNLYANQISKTGSGIKGSHFYNSTPVLNLLEISDDKSKENTLKNTLKNTLEETSIKDGKYKLSFSSYVPTYKENVIDGRQYANGSFDLFFPLLNLSDNPNFYRSIGDNLSFQFKPKFVTSIKGSIIDDGLVVGVKQESKININKSNPNSNSTLNGEVLVNYGKVVEQGGKKDHSNFELNFFKDNSWKTISGPNDTTQTGLNKIGPNDFITLLRQKGKIANLKDKTFLATHIKDKIDGVEVIYSSFAIGLKNYEKSEVEGGNNTFQRRIKISGTVHSHSKSEVFDTEKISQLGNIDKSELQKNVRKNVLDGIRNVKGLRKDGVSSISNLYNLSSNGGVEVGDTLYFEKDNGENITISGSYSGVKNIVIYGGNAYITGDITTQDKKNILSIISVEKNGKGGNIYIKPSVEKIHSVLYADKAVLSYEYVNSNDKFDFNYKELKNQLYIYGSVFSNNTIGGSVMTDNNGNPAPKCPYYIPKNDCTATEGDKVGTSEKYDLYNLRRGYENIYDTILDKKPYVSANLKTGFTEDKDGYTLIIEYNPLIQSSKNPFFTVKK